MGRLVMKVSDLARVLGISRKTILRLIARRELKAVRLGGQLLIPIREIERVLGLEGSITDLQE